MEMKPGYKRTEVGVIPQDWDVVPLSALFEFRNGANADKEAYGRGLRFINVLEIITRGHLRASHIPGRVALPKVVIDEFNVIYGDLVFNRTSETQEEVGLAAVYLDSEVVVFGGFVIRGRQITDCLDPIFSGYAFREVPIHPQIVARGQGAVRANIGQSDLKQVIIPIPPIEEQRAIAAALSDADALIESLEHLVAKKRHISQGAMQELLTGKRRLPGFSGEWKTNTLAELFSFSGGYSASRDQLSNVGHFYLHYGDIHGASKTYIDVSAERDEIPRLNIQLTRISPNSLLADGDIVFVDASEDDEGASRHVVIVNPDRVPYIAGLHTIVAKATSGDLDLDFRRYCFQTREIKKQFLYYAVGTKVKGVSKGNIGKIVVRLPPQPEQAAIASVLSDMDAEIAALETKLAKARQVKQGMMQELLTGKTRLL